MKRLGMNKMTVVYSREDMPKDETKSMFLAGPVPRKEYELSKWDIMVLYIFLKIE